MTTAALIVSVGILGTTAAAGQPIAPPDPAAAPAVKSPRVQIVPTAIDFGTMDDSTVRTQTVTLTNVGDAVLVIPEGDGVKGSCGCTVPTLPKYQIAPGESVEMQVNFDPRKRQGSQSKTVTINSNAGAPVVIPVDAFVIQRVVFVEGDAVFNGVNQGEAATFVMHVQGMDPEFQVTSATVSRDDAFDVKILQTAVVEREDKQTGEIAMVGQTTLEVTLRENASVGRIDATLDIQTTDPVSTSHQTRVIATVVGDVRLDPPAVQLGALEPGAAFEKAFTIYSHRGTPFNISRVVLVTNDMSPEDKARITVSHEPLPADAGKVGYTVTIKGDVSETMRLIRGNVVLMTDAPGQTVVSARLAGVVRVARQ
jgi:hypothetical protein